MLTGCVGAAEVVYVPWPDLGPEVRTVVLLLERPGAGAALSAFAAHEAPALELEEGSELLVLGYAESPEQFGTGPLDPSATHLGCFLSFPHRVLRLVPGDASFEESALLSDERERLNGGRTCLACLEFREQRVIIEGQDSGPLIRLPSGAAVLTAAYPSASDRRFYRIDRSGAVELIQGCEGRGYSSSAPESSTAWWLGGPDGLLERLDFDEGTRTCTVSLSTRTPSLPEFQRGILNSVSVSRDGASLEVLAASSSGRLDRFDPDTGWMPIGRLEPLPSSANADVSVIHTKVGEAVMSVGDVRVAFWRRGEALRERIAPLEPPLDPYSPAIITTLARAPSGFWVGDSEGRVSSWGDGVDFQRLPLPLELASVGFVHARGLGLVALTDGGRVLQVNDGHQPCPNVPVIRGGFRNVPRHAFVEPDGSMFVADAISAGSMRIGAWLWPE